MKDIDADYYGYRDDDDGILIPLEEKVEKEAREKLMELWATLKEQGEDIEDVEINDETTSQKQIPTRQDMHDALLEKKKQELLAKYL